MRHRKRIVFGLMLSVLVLVGCNSLPSKTHQVATDDLHHDEIQGTATKELVTPTPVAQLSTPTEIIPPTPTDEAGMSEERMIDEEGIPLSPIRRNKLVYLPAYQIAPSQTPGWNQVTNLDYGFTFRYPADLPIATSGNVIRIYWGEQNLAIGFRRAEESLSFQFLAPLYLFRDSQQVDRGTLDFLGMTIPKSALVFSQQECIILYNNSSEAEAKKMAAEAQVGQVNFTAVIESPIDFRQPPSCQDATTPSPTSETVYENSFAVAFPANGRSLAFDSSLDGQMDAFVYDTAHGAIELASLFSPDEPLVPSAPRATSLSADGRFLLFGGMANGLDTFVFLRDRQEGTTERIDFSPVARWLNQVISPHVLSPDGQYLALTVTGLQSNIYLYEIASGQATLVSAGRDGQESDGSSFDPVFSPDGSFLAFFSTASNLIGGDTACSAANPGCGDIFLYELESGQLTRIPAGLPLVMGWTPSLALSDRAYQVAWTGGFGKDGEFRFPTVIHLLDRLYRQSEVACADEPCSGHSPALSADGRWLAFATQGEYTEGGNQPPYAQVYLRDWQSGETTLVSTDAGGAPGNDNSGIIYLQQEGWNSDLTISADGDWLAFSSQASSLLPAGVEKRVCYSPFLGAGGETYPCYDLFVYNRPEGTLTWISKP